MSSSLDSSKRQRTEESRQSASSPSSSSASADALLLRQSISSVEQQPLESTAMRDLLERLLAKQDYIVAEVSRLQTTVDSVLHTLKQNNLLDSSGVAMTPRLANIVVTTDMPAGTINIADSRHSTSPQSMMEAPNTAAPSIRRHHFRSPPASNIAINAPHQQYAQNYRQAGSAASCASPPGSGGIIGSQSAGPISAQEAVTLPPPSTLSRSHHHQQHVHSAASSNTAGMSSRTYNQHHSRSTPADMGIPYNASRYPSTNNQPQQRYSGISLSAGGHSPHIQQQGKMLPRPYPQPGQTPVYGTSHRATARGNSPSKDKHSSVAHADRETKSILLPPIRTSVSTIATTSATGPPLPPPASALGRMPPAASASIQQQHNRPSMSPYSPSIPLASGMHAEATHSIAGTPPTTTGIMPKPQPSPSAQQQQQYHYPHLPGISGLARASSTVTSGGVSNRSMTASSSLTPVSKSHATASKPSSSLTNTQQKIEKNRFQANIRAFVDQHFNSPENAHWDYQQSFKAPRNAQATHELVQAFHALHGGSYERIEHGLGVYFSSLKAKHRTTEDKAMLKQQRDRRRARRIKKAAGRRKVFDRAQFPFLPHDFDAQHCFVPSAMSPEHTDDDGEVKVGVLPWRANKFHKLFRHLDTLRPKRTPRPQNNSLNGGSAPPNDMPEYMLDSEYVAVDRAHVEQHDLEEEDIEMDSSSDGVTSQAGSSGVHV